jgi:hypothetical protein
MPDTTCHMSISLDGFVAGPDQSRENPLGKPDRFGLSFDPNYAEAADFEFASEQPEEAPAGRV